MIRAENIQKSYGELQVLRGVSLELNKAEVVSLVGASGAGKTTLLQILGTLDEADSGKVYLKDQDITALSPNELADFRNRNMGFIFQFHHLLPEFSALENVCIPGFIAGHKKADVEKRAKELLNMMGLSDRYKHRPSSMSGGECQRVAVARALINDPAIILADEPTGSLDSENALQIHELFMDLREKLGQTFLIITHNEELAEMADRRIHIKDGQIVAQ